MLFFLFLQSRKAISKKNFPIKASLADCFLNLSLLVVVPYSETT